MLFDAIAPVTMAPRVCDSANDPYRIVNRQTRRLPTRARLQVRYQAYVGGFMAGLLAACAVAVGHAAADTRAAPSSTRPTTAATACSVPSRTLAQSGSGRVIEHATPNGPQIQPGVWGCWGHLRPGLFLGYNLRAEKAYELVGPFAIAGRVLAYQYDLVDDIFSPGPNNVVIAVDLRSRQRLWKWRSGFLPGLQGGMVAQSVGPIESIIAAANGTVAWITAQGVNIEAPQPTPYQVVVASRAGTRLLATSTDIDPKSLQLSGTTLTWTAGGHSEAAPL